MQLWPHLREILLGPVGLGCLVWAIVVIWLGAANRVTALSVVLAATALALAVSAGVALEVSAAPYSPNRDMPVIASGLFVTFSLAAFLTAIVAVALAVPVIRNRLRKP